MTWSPAVSTLWALARAFHSGSEPSRFLPLLALCLHQHGPPAPGYSSWNGFLHCHLSGRSLWSTVSRPPPCHGFKAFRCSYPFSSVLKLPLFIVPFYYRICRILLESSVLQILPAHNSKFFERGQDGGGIGRGDHFLFYKFIERTTERWRKFTKQLLIASSGHQAPRKAAHCLRREVGQKY